MKDRFWADEPTIFDRLDRSSRAKGTRIADIAKALYSGQYGHVLAGYFPGVEPLEHLVHQHPRGAIKLTSLTGIAGLTVLMAVSADRPLAEAQTVTPSDNSQANTLQIDNDTPAGIPQLDGSELRIVDQRSTPDAPKPPDEAKAAVPPAGEQKPEERPNTDEPNAPEDVVSGGGSTDLPEAVDQEIAPVEQQQPVVVTRPRPASEPDGDPYPEDRSDGSIVLVQRFTDGSFKDVEEVKGADPQSSAQPAPPAVSGRERLEVDGAFKLRLTAPNQARKPKNAEEQRIFNEDEAFVTDWFAKVLQTAARINDPELNRMMELFKTVNYRRGGPSTERVLVFVEPRYIASHPQQPGKYEVPIGFNVGLNPQGEPWFQFFLTGDRTRHDYNTPGGVHSVLESYRALWEWQDGKSDIESGLSNEEIAARFNTPQKRVWGVAKEFEAVLQLYERIRPVLGKLGIPTSPYWDGLLFNAWNKSKRGDGSIDQFQWLWNINRFTQNGLTDDQVRKLMAEKNR